MNFWTKEFDTAEKRFWSKVDQSAGPDACWPWTGGGTKRGYGVFSFGGKKFYAHVFSFKLANGCVAEETRHSCDNVKCCNPKHLLNGTHLDNIQDAVDRNRVEYGERHHNARLTETQVVSIRQRYKPHCRVNGTRAIARELGVNQMTISYIVRRVNWRRA